jgi:hypothetical protein
MSQTSGGIRVWHDKQKASILWIGSNSTRAQSEAAPSAESILEEVAAVFVFLGKVYLINGTDYTFSLSLLVRRPCILTAS